jgi:hypothetical protein
MNTISERRNCPMPKDGDKLLDQNFQKYKEDDSEKALVLALQEVYLEETIEEGLTVFDPLKKHRK